MGLVALYCSLIRTNRLAKKVNSHEIPIIQLSAHDDASVDGNINDAKKRKYGESEKCAIEREKGELGYIKRTWRENMSGGSRTMSKRSISLICACFPISPLS